MKKNFILSTAVAGIVAASALTVSAAGFAKTNSYTQGQFADVNTDQWYASSVASAFELGFMKGSSDTTFEPEGNMTVAEAITIASRVNDAYNAGKAAVEAAAAKAEAELQELRKQANDKAVSDAGALSAEVESKKAAMRAVAEARLEKAAALVVERIVNS